MEHRIHRQGDAEVQRQRQRDQEQALSDHVIKYFKRQQKDALDDFLRLAEYDLVKRDTSARKVLKELRSNEGLMLYLRLVNKDPEQVLAPTLAKGGEKASGLEKAVSEVMTREALAKWWMLDYVPHSPISQSVFNAMKNKLNKFFEYVRTDGYNPTTNQSSVQIYLVNPAVRDNADAVIEELSVWLPLVKPIVTLAEDSGLDKRHAEWAGWKRTSIMEPSLSSSGIWSLYFKEGKAKLVKTTWGRDQIHAEGPCDEVVRKAVEQLGEPEDKDD